MEVRRGEGADGGDQGPGFEGKLLGVEAPEGLAHKFCENGQPVSVGQKFISVGDGEYACEAFCVMIQELGDGTLEVPMGREFLKVVLKGAVALHGLDIGVDAELIFAVGFDDV